MIYALWRDSAGGGGAVAPRLDAERRQATRIWQPHDEHDVALVSPASSLRLPNLRMAMRPVPRS